MEILSKQGKLKVEVTSIVTEIVIGTTTVVGGISGRVLYDNAGIVGELDLSAIYVPTTRTLTINGTTQDLSADRTFTISTGITIGTTAITSGTVGRVLFEGTGNVVQESANLFWDNTNGRLGIGTSSPTAKMHIVGAGTTNATFGLLVTNSAGSLSFRVEDNADIRIAKDIAAFIRSYSTANGASFPSYSFSGNSSSGLYQDGANTIGIATGGTSRLQIASTGNVLINTTTDAGFRLDVNGTARVQGNLTASNFIGFVRSDAFSSANGGFVVFATSGSNGNARFNQFVSIGTNSEPVASAALDVVSTTKGFLPPRMTTTQKNAIASPAAGLQIFDTTLNRPCFYDGTTWITL